MRSLFLSYFVYIRYTAIFYFGKLTESNNLSLLKCILYYTINVVVNLLRREKGMESIIIKPERVFQEGYRYYISYITHPVKWKSALRKWYFIKYVRDLDLFSFERQHYPYNLVFVCCNPPERELKCSQFPSCVDFTGFNCIQNCVYCYYLSFFSKIALKHRPHYFHI